LSALNLAVDANTGEEDEYGQRYLLGSRMTDLELLSAVGLTEDLSEKRLLRGQVGTIVDRLGPDIYEVEFSDGAGQTYAVASVPAVLLMQLHHEPKHHSA